MSEKCFYCNGIVRNQYKRVYNGLAFCGDDCVRKFRFEEILNYIKERRGE